MSTQLYIHFTRSWGIASHSSNLVFVISYHSMFQLTTTSKLCNTLQKSPKFVPLIPRLSISYVILTTISYLALLNIKLLLITALHDVIADRRCSIEPIPDSTKTLYIFLSALKSSISVYFNSFCIYCSTFYPLYLNVCRHATYSKSEKSIIKICGIRLLLF